MIPYGRHVVTEEDRAAALRALDSGCLTGGPEVVAFEAELGQACGSEEVVAVANGTVALHLVAALLDAPRGAAWLVPSCTFAASAQAGVYAGYEPVFIDCDPLTGLILPADLERALAELNAAGREVAAAVVVDLNGHPAPLAECLELLFTYGVPLIRDAAHSLGAIDPTGEPVGADSGVFATTLSFHPVKLLSAGEGGAVLGLSSELAGRARSLRSHAMRRCPERPTEYEITAVGYNYRLSELHSALGRSQLARIAEKLAIRRRLAERYAAALSGMGPALRWVRPPAGQSAWHLASVLIEPSLRWRVHDELRKRGVGAAHHYPALHRQPVYAAALKKGRRPLPGAEAYTDRQLTLPLFESLTEPEQDEVVRQLQLVLNTIGA